MKQAANLYWSQLKNGPQLKKRSSPSISQFDAGFAAHYAILLTFVRLSRGVIHLPENEKFYTAKGFARHIHSLAKQRSGSSA